MIQLDFIHPSLLTGHTLQGVAGHSELPHPLTSRMIISPNERTVEACVCPPFFHLSFIVSKIDK